MQFTKAIFSFLAVGSAFADSENSFSKRDLATIQSEIGKVQTALGDLGTAVNGLSADPNSAAPVLTASQNAESVIKSATTTIQATDELGLTDALSLQDTATQLTDAVTTTIDALVSKKSVLDQLGVTSVAVQTLQDQKTASDALGQAIVSKVPAIGQNIAQQSISQISQALDEGITALSVAGGGVVGNGTAPGNSTATATPVQGGLGGNATTTTVIATGSVMTVVPVEAANGTCMCSVLE